MTSVRVAVPFLVAVLSTAVPAYAQQDDRRGFIGLGIGPSMPVGSFGGESPVPSMGRGATTWYTSTLVNVGYRFQRSLGLAVGLLLAAGSMALMASGGMEIFAWSFPVAGVVCAVLGGTGLAAIFAPAWRATRVNPVEALRAE